MLVDRNPAGSFVTCTLACTIAWPVIVIQWFIDVWTGTREFIDGESVSAQTSVDYVCPGNYVGGPDARPY